MSKHLVTVTYELEGASLECWLSAHPIGLTDEQGGYIIGLIIRPEPVEDDEE